jgi:site-specific recombinase XerD
MDARTVLAQWLDEHNPDRRGKQGRLLQGSSPERYKEHVEDWLVFIDETVKIGAWKAEPSHVKTWLDMRGGAARTRALRVSAVGAFYTFATHFKYAPHNPVDPRLSGKAHETPPGPRLDSAQMHLLRWAADKLEGRDAERNRLFAYLNLGGLRSRQITEFELPGVVFEQSGRMVGDVWQKGGGTRRYAFPPEIGDAVRAYVPVRTWRPPSSSEERGPLLVTYRGNRLDPETTPRTLLREVVALARGCQEPDAPELPPRITPDMVALSPSPFEPLVRL